MKTVFSNQLIACLDSFPLLQRITPPIRGRMLRWASILLVSLGLAAINMASASEGVFVPAGNTVYNHGIYARAVELVDGRVLLMGGRILGPNHMLSATDIYDPATGQFTTVGGLNHGRSGFGAVRLVDGRVLVVGGETGSQFGQALASAEVYDPASGTFAFVPGMSAARYQPAATRLADGRVLVTGGADNGQNVQSSADIYDAGAISVVGVPGEMNHPRAGHSATLLANGTVLLAGGAPSSNGAQAPAEIFDPQTGSFVLVDSMGSPRSYHATLRLNDGRVLLTGGYNGSVAVKTAEIFDPETETFSPVGDMAEARYLHTTSLLPDGRVLVVGGTTLSSVGTATAEVFDPATLTFAPAGNLSAARCCHMAATLPDGDVLIAAGYNSCNGNLASAERFSLAVEAPGTFVPAGNTPNNHGIYARAAELNDGRVLIVGGRILGPNNMVAATSIYDPITGDFSNTGGMGLPRSAHTATTLPSGKVLVAGGEIAPVAGAMTASAEIYNPATGSFEPAGDMSVARYFHEAVRLNDGRVLVLGGVNNSSGNSTAEIYDPASNTFLPPVNMTASRTAPTATKLLDGRVLVAGGGVGYTGTYEASAEIYDPSTGIFTATGSMTAPRSGHTATLLSDGKVLIAGGYDGNFSSSAEIYDPATGQFSAVGSMMEARYFHVALPLPGNRALVTGGFNNSYPAGLSSAEVYDPGTQSFIPAGSMNQGRWSPIAASLGGGRFLVAAGYDACAGNLTSAEIFDSAVSTIVDPTVTWPTPAPIPHGTALSGAQLNAAATAYGTNVNGTFTYTPPAGTILNAGPNQTLSVTFAPEDTAHFNAVSATVQIDVIDDVPPGTLLSWGENIYGEIGPAGDEIVEPTPVRHPGLDDVSAIAAGNKFTLVLKSDGTVWAWGYNANGQLGDGTTVSRNSAVAVAGLSSVVAIDAGGYASLALRSDGTVWSWGHGGLGQLGNGADQDSHVPVQVQNLDRVVAVAVGVIHSAALREDGTVWRWGAQYGGNGGIELLPLQVAGVSDIVALSAGENVTVALKADGTVWAWGNDGSGQNGNGPGSDPGPTAVQGLNNITAVSCGVGHVLALRSDGTVWAWGRNSSGELGDGTTVDRDVPVQVQGIGSVMQIAAGGYHNLALKADGTLWSWGYGHVGQLGTGDLLPAPTAPAPVLIPAGMNLIAADFLHSVAMQTVVARPPLNTSHPSPQTACLGAPATFSVNASGTVSGYQWRKDGVNLADGGSVSGASSATLTLSAVAAADAGQYDVVLTYAAGAVNSAAATLVVQQPPQISTGPAGAMRIEGESITFTVVAIGTGPLSYQWRKNGTAIPGATGASLILNSLGAGDAGSYDVLVSGICAPNAVSAPAVLTVIPAGNTPVGEDVVVAPVDPATGTSPVSVTFSETTQPGQTTVTSSQMGPPPPDGFKVGQPPVYYDVSTTASFTGPVQLCFSYAGLSVGKESKLKLFHFENGAWVNVTTSLDTVNDIICGTVTSLSPFAVFEEENQAPVITTITGPTAPLALGASATVAVSFTDADAGDSHTVAFAWDDGSNSSVSATGGAATSSHSFTASGVYTVTVTVTDSNGGTALARFEYVVIYDPSGGFVTGGGWIQSPAGAYVAAPTLSGKATFGFNSKYQHGANVPTGNTEFKLHFASFTFRSTEYQWLVVAGPKAQFKGSGTINGAGNYRFLLTGRDGQANGGGGVDKFRIKIWEAATEAVVYDNVLGASDDIDTANPTAIGGGSIVIHKPN